MIAVATVRAMPSSLATRPMMNPPPRTLKVVVAPSRAMRTLAKASVQRLTVRTLLVASGAAIDCVAVAELLPECLGCLLRADGLRDGHGGHLVLLRYVACATASDVQGADPVAGRRVDEGAAGGFRSDCLERPGP